MNWKNELNKPCLYQEGKWITLKEYVILEKMKDEFEIRPANKIDVKDFVMRHYLQKFPTGIKKIYSIWQKSPEKMIGMIIYGIPFPTAAKFLEPEITLRETLELKRLFIDDIGVKNLESFVIGQSLKLLKQDEPSIKVVITFADDVQGHVGAIYQATNAIYIGQNKGGGAAPDMNQPKRAIGKHKYVYILRGDIDSIKNKLKPQPYPKKEITEIINKNANLFLGFIERANNYKLSATDVNSRIEKHAQFWSRIHPDSEDIFDWRYRKDLNTVYYWYDDIPKEKERDIMENWIRNTFGIKEPPKYVRMEHYTDEFSRAHDVNWKRNNNNNAITEIINKNANLFLGFINRDNFKVVGTSSEDGGWIHSQYRKTLGPEWQGISKVPWRYRKDLNIIYWWDEYEPTEDEKEALVNWLKDNLNITQTPTHTIIYPSEMNAFSVDNNRRNVDLAHGDGIDENNKKSSSLFMRLKEAFYHPLKRKVKILNQSH